MVSKKEKGLILIIIGAILIYSAEAIFHENEIAVLAVGFIGFACLLDGIFDIYNYFR